MRTSRKLFQILKKLTPTDLDLLHHLYLYRCLTLEQAKNYIYKREDKTLEAFHQEYVRHLLRLNVVEKVEYIPNKYVLFLTTNGVDAVRYTKEIPLEIFNPDTKIVKRGYYRAGELKMHPRLINHQVFLNQFMLEFQEMANERGIKWKYYDEKYVSQYFTIRPDGLIQLFDTDFFLEMDMGTESKKQLSKKWDHYRDFVRSTEFTNKENKVMILFITENVKNVERRKDLVRFTAIHQISDLFQGSFDMVIGSKNELLELMFNTLIPNILQENKKKEEILETLRKKHELRVDFAYPLRSALNDSDYEFYIRKVNENKRIIKENGRLQEFILDDYTYRPLSVIHRIQYHQRNSNVFNLKYKRNIPYIVIAKDEKSLLEDLKIADALTAEQVYFTTPKRLKERLFHEALFQFGIQGEIYHFADSGLQQRVFEKEQEN